MGTTFGGGLFGGFEWGGTGSPSPSPSQSNSAGQPQAATIIASTTPILWDDGLLFNGWLLLGIAMPSGGASSSYPSATLWGVSPPQPLPKWTMIPIVQGALDTNTTVYLTNYLDPPGCQYVAYWLDTNRNQVYPPSGTSPSLFTITSTTYTITVPTLTSPTASTTVPAPQSGAYPGSYLPNTVYAIPSQETPGGTVDGSNTAFTLSRLPNFLLFFIDGQAQDPTTYSYAYVSGVPTVTLTTPPTAGAAVRAILF